MTFYRKVANSDILKKVIDLPESLQNKEVEILIFPYEDNKDEEKVSEKKKSARGVLEKYKDIDLLKQENGAWSKAVEDKYENR
ncbi:hypothetical protein MHZ95_11620 [Sporosarcina sp. ACRSM]|uniref:hypothetical protein n=1 Tax=Sporosarcina sp. ACRSM TaxID=2918216 RepID=UPI001EF69AF1|nr:hypothetical protein [Sporosarcina sp. ACRSM]MCG7335930.1 hypothetical protein [Sporosarcina sp. ACRSM]